MITFQRMQDVVIFIGRLANEGFIKPHLTANQTSFKADALTLGQQFLMNSEGETYFLPDLLALSEAEAASSPVAFRSEKSQTTAYTLHAVWHHCKRNQAIQTLGLIHNVAFAKALLEMIMENGKLHLRLPAYLVDPCLVLEGREYGFHNAFNLKTQLSLVKGTGLLVSPEPGITLTKQSIVDNKVLRQLIDCDFPARLSDGRWIELATYKQNLIQWEQYWAQKEKKCVRKMGNSALAQKTTPELGIMQAEISAKLTDCLMHKARAELRAKKITKYLVMINILLFLISFMALCSGILALGVDMGAGLPITLVAVGAMGIGACMPYRTRIIKSKVEAKILNYLQIRLDQEEDQLIAQANDIQYILTRRHKRPNDLALMLAKKETIQVARAELTEKIAAISRKPSLWQQVKQTHAAHDEETVSLLAAQNAPRSSCLL